MASACLLAGGLAPLPKEMTTPRRPTRQTSIAWSSSSPASARSHRPPAGTPAPGGRFDPSRTPRLPTRICRPGPDAQSSTGMNSTPSQSLVRRPRGAVLQTVSLWSLARQGRGSGASLCWAELGCPAFFCVRLGSYLLNFNEIDVIQSRSVSLCPLTESGVEDLKCPIHRALSTACAFTQVTQKEMGRLVKYRTN